MSLPPGNEGVADSAPAPGAVAFSDTAGALAGLLIAAPPQDAGALPLVAFAVSAGDTRLVAAAGESASLEVGACGRLWRWSAPGTGYAGEVEVSPTDDATSDPPTPASGAATNRPCCQGWISRRASVLISGPDGERTVQANGLLRVGPILADPDTPLARWVAAWMSNGVTVTLDAHRPRPGPSHASEELAAWVSEEAGSAARPVSQPLLSTTYDAAGRPRRAGLELWMDEEAEFPRRAAGEAQATTTLVAGGLRWDVSFLSWTMEGRAGSGPYIIARREG